MKVVLVINSHASRAHQHIDEILSYFSDASCSNIEIKDSSAFDSSMKQAIKLKPDRLILAGGDGTILAGIALAQALKHGCSFGIIPIGTANYFARNIGVSLDIQTACKQAVSDKSTDVSLAKANQNIFALAAMTGIVGEASGRTTKKMKQTYGQASYIVMLFKILRRQDIFRYTVRFSGKTINGSSHQILVANSELSNVVALAPDVDISKRLLRLVIYDASSKSVLFVHFLLYALSFGRLKRGIQTYTSESFELETKPSRNISLDGDFRLETPATFKTVDKLVSIAR